MQTVSLRFVDNYHILRTRGSAWERLQNSWTSVSRYRLAYTPSYLQFLVFYSVNVQCSLTIHQWRDKQKWFARDVPYYVKIWPKLAHPLQKRRFPINIRS